MIGPGSDRNCAGFMDMTDFRLRFIAYNLFRSIVNAISVFNFLLDFLAKCYFPPKKSLFIGFWTVAREFGMLLEKLFKTLITLEPDVLFISDASRNYWLKNYCIRPLSDFLKSVSLAVIMTTITF